MSKQYRLLVIDIDGTLIDRYGEISAENREALEMARRAGTQVALSTGRSLISTMKVIEQLSLDSYHIFFDGALAANPHTGEDIYTRPIAGDILRRMIEYARANRLDLELYSKTGYFGERESWSTKAHRDFFGIQPTIGSFDGLRERERIVKAGLVTNRPEQEVGVRGFIEHFGDSLHAYQVKVPAFPEATFNNILAPGTSKGRTLETLAARLEIPLEEVMAVGDGHNDISLLATAGLGVAMGNAHEDVKQAADRITRHVEEHGLAAAIRDFLV